MADSTPLLVQVEPDQASKEVTVNGLIAAASPATAYGRHAEACIGLTWAYYGTRYGGSAVANGTNVCGASTTTYMVVHLTTGAVSFATGTTNWDDATTYGRAYKIVTGTDAVTSYEDHRFGPLGIMTAAAVAGSGDMLLASAQTVTGAKTFGSAGAVGKLKVAGTTSGAATIDAPAVAGSVVITLPGVTSTLATNSQTGEFISGYIGTVTDKTYKIVVKAAHGGTITETTTISESGTVTATFKINTTALGGTANSVSNSEQSQSHSGSNVFAAGDDLQITTSSNSTCLGFSFTIKYTRTLA